MKTEQMIHIIDFSSIPAGRNQSGFVIVLNKAFAETVRNIQR